MTDLISACPEKVFAKQALYSRNSHQFLRFTNNKNDKYKVISPKLVIFSVKFTFFKDFLSILDSSFR